MYVAATVTTAAFPEYALAVVTKWSANTPRLSLKSDEYIRLIGDLGNVEICGVPAPAPKTILRHLGHPLIERGEGKGEGRRYLEVFDLPGFLPDGRAGD